MNQDAVPAGATRITLPRLSDEEAGRRTLEDRLTVRFPGLYRRLSAATMRHLPAGSLRRNIVARGITRSYAAANRRDFELLLVLIDRDHQYRPSAEIMPPDLGGPTRGHEGYLRMWNYWLDSFGDIRYEPEEVLDFGEKFLVTVRQVGHGSSSGVGLARPVYQLLTMRGGRTVMQEDFVDRAQAIASAQSSAVAPLTAK
jgi:ketosteroid isomerase-like protein